MAVAALPDDRRALSASADKTLKLWDLETGNPLAAFTADSDLFAVAVAANNPSANWISASCLADNPEDGKRISCSRRPATGRSISTSSA
jgi:WD40 repeat protein